MGVSNPNNTDFETAGPTQNVNTNVESYCPTQHQLRAILYVVEEDPKSRYVSETQKQQTPNHKPKPKAQ